MRVRQRGRRDRPGWRLGCREGYRRGGPQPAEIAGLSTARSADPPIEVEVESVGEILRVAVPPQKRKPYSFGGRFFMRDGASSQQMSNAEVEDLFYAAGRLHFDRKPCLDDGERPR